MLFIWTGKMQSDLLYLYICLIIRIDGLVLNGPEKNFD